MFTDSDVTPAQAAAYNVLATAMESLQKEGISHVMVLCFTHDSRPVGMMTNVEGDLQRVGLLEVMKHSILCCNEE